MKKLDIYVIKSRRNHYTLCGVTLAQAKASARVNSEICGYTGVYKMIDGILVQLYGAENGKISHRSEEA